MATGVAPAMNIAAPGIVALQTHRMVTKHAIPESVSLKLGFDGRSDWDMATRHRFRQNEGMNRTRIAKISIRPIIISQTNRISVGELKWP